jgi:hypothetical protein
MRYWMLILIGSVGLGFMAIPAEANWQYTQWNMTREQLIAAAGGRAHLVAADQGFGGGKQTLEQKERIPREVLISRPNSTSILLDGSDS